MSKLASQDFEIPMPQERKFRYRFFEALPGILSWTVLTSPFWLGFLNVSLAALLMLLYLMLWFVRAAALNVRGIQSFRRLDQHKKLPWRELHAEVIAAQKGDTIQRRVPKWHLSNISRILEDPNGIDPEKIVHVIIIATYNETREVIEPTLQAVLDNDVDMSRVAVFLAYEERGGAEVEAQAIKLMSDYKGKFMHSEAVKHPGHMPNEVRGKGGNITFAGFRAAEWVKSKGLEPKQVLVTTLDADNRPDKQYLPCLDYIYSVCYAPKNLSFQPIPMFTNNIWDAPAPMRVIATGNSYWMMVQALRHHMLRNFSAHSQPLDALIETDFWSVRTIVEDGHQFWRSYFAFDGKHEVIPIFLPIYQDAVLASGYVKTLKQQFIQIRRWAWGASDVAYVAENAFFKPNSIPLWDRLAKFFRLLEGHVSWSSSPLILAFGAFIPFLFHNTDYLANQLPQLASRIQTLAMLGIFVTLYLSFKILPPKPARYKRRRSLAMLLQWVLLPLTTIGYSASAAIYSQTRLIFGKYIGGFDVTEKAVVTDKGMATSLKDGKQS
jgi:cellulose synthase/poly-beta-1,6-N-acetylglucosamine synthase-like glycosyltransferase